MTSTNYVSVNHRAMNFCLEIGRPLWEKTKEHVRGVVSMETFIENCHKEYIRADYDRRLIMESNAETFAKEVERAGDAVAYARSAILNDFWNYPKVMAISYAALMSETLPEATVYQLFVDAMAIQKSFVTLNGLNSAGIPKKDMH